MPGEGRDGWGLTEEESEGQEKKDLCREQPVQTLERRVQRRDRTPRRAMWRERKGRGQRG